MESAGRHAWREGDGVYCEERPVDHMACQSAAWRFETTEQGKNTLVARHALLFRGMRLLHAHAVGPVLWEDRVSGTGKYHHRSNHAQYVCRAENSKAVHG